MRQKLPITVVPDLQADAHTSFAFHSGSHSPACPLPPKAQPLRDWLSRDGTARGWPDLWLGSLLWLLTLLLPVAAWGAETKEVEFRAITVMDGTVYKGIVTASDDTNLTLKTLKGPVKVPIMDILQVDPIDREEFLLAEGRRMIFLGVDGSGASQDRSTLMERELLALLSRDDLLVVPIIGLSLRTRQQLQSCSDLNCRLEALRDEQTQVVYGVLKGRDKQERLILRRLDRNLAQVYELTITVGDPRAERSRLAKSVALLLGETPVEEPVVAKAPVEPASDKTTGPSDKNAASGKNSGTGKTAGTDTTDTAKTGTVAGAGKTDPKAGTRADDKPPARADGKTATSTSNSANNSATSGSNTSNAGKTGNGTSSAPTADSKTADSKNSDSKNSDSKNSDSKTAATKPAQTPSKPSNDGEASASSPSRPATDPAKLAARNQAIQEARRLDLIPVPGASSILYFKDNRGTILAASSVAVLTTASVYLAGNMRVLGMPDGLPVSWTYPDRGAKDALLLGGVGAVSYVASTLLINQAVRVIQLKWHFP